MFRFRSIPFVGAALLLLSGLPFSYGPANAADPGAPTLLDYKALKPGTKGYGLTVFSGTTPERFDVEVISVLNHFLPSQDLILIKTHHPRLDVAKIVAGMSGSPIYIDGKMIGAYAYGWTFQEESIAGVTPIGAMLDELRRPIPPEFLQPLGRPIPGPSRVARALPPAAGVRFAGAPLDYDLAAHANQVKALSAPRSADGSGPALTPVATPLMVGGLSENSIAALRTHLSPLGLEPMQGGGAASTQDPTAPTKYVDGGGIGVQLVRGDMSITGVGTVTRVSGNRVLAFGHPMMGSGVSRLPAAIAKIHWILASKMRSFKLGEPVRPMGSLVNDRQAAIVVDASVDPPMIPLSLDVVGADGAPHPRWSMEVAHERFMAPMFIAIALGNAVESTTSEKRDVTWVAETKLKIAGHGTVTLEDFGVAVGGTPDAGEFMRSLAVRAVGALLSNPWEPVDIEGLETKLTVRFARDVLQLRGVEVLDPEVDAGKSVRLRLSLLPFAGPMQTRIVEIPIPRELAGQTVEIKLVPGNDEVPEVARPENINDFISSLPKLSYPPDVLVASMNVASQGVAYHGQVATRLPPGALDTLRPRTSSVSPEPIPSLVRSIIPIHQFIVGDDTVQVRVRNVLR